MKTQDKQKFEYDAENLKELLDSISDSYHSIHPDWSYTPDYHLLSLEDMISASDVRAWKSKTTVGIDFTKEDSDKLEYSGKLSIYRNGGTKTYDTRFETSLKLDGIMGWTGNLLNILSTCDRMPKRIVLKGVKYITGEFWASSEYNNVDKEWTGTAYNPFKTTIEALNGEKIVIENTIFWTGESSNDFKSDKNISVEYQNGKRKLMVLDGYDRHLIDHYRNLFHGIMNAELKNIEASLSLDGKSVNPRDYVDKLLLSYLDKLNVCKISSELSMKYSPQENDAIDALQLKLAKIVGMQSNEVIIQGVLPSLYLARDAGLVKSYKKIKPLIDNLESMQDGIEKRIGKVLQKNRAPNVYA